MKAAWKLVLRYLCLPDFFNARSCDRTIFQASNDKSIFSTVIANTIQLEADVQKRALYVTKTGLNKNPNIAAHDIFRETVKSSNLDSVLFYTAVQLNHRLRHPQMISYKCFNEGNWVSMLHYNPVPIKCLSCGSGNLDRNHTNYRNAPTWSKDPHVYVEELLKPKNKTRK